MTPGARAGASLAAVGAVPEVVIAVVIEMVIEVGPAVAIGVVP